MENLKKLLSLEAHYRIRPELLDELLSAGTVINLDKYEALIDSGVYDPNIYIVKKGLIRGTYMDKNIEKTAGFALPGVLLISFHCYYNQESSFYRFEACCPTTLVKIPKRHFDGMIAKHHEFAQWVLSAHQNQLYYTECKNQFLSGDAKSRLLHLTQNISGIPQLTERVGPGTLDDKTHSDMVKKEAYLRWKDIFNLVPYKIIASYLGITEQHLSKIKKELLRE